MDRIIALMWLSLIVVTACLGVGCGGGTGEKPAAEGRNPKQVEKVVDQLVEGRNPKLVEMVIDQPKEYPGFFYAVCDEDDPEFFRKVRLATDYSYLERVMTVVEINVRGLKTPFQSWEIFWPLPLAYDATELEIRMMATDKLVLKRVYVLQHGRFVECPEKEWRKQGLSVKDAPLYKMNVSANDTDHIRGWLILLDSTVPYMIHPGSGMEISHCHQLQVMQLPKMDVVTLEDIKKYAAKFKAAYRRTFEYGMK